MHFAKHQAFLRSPCTFPRLAAMLSAGVGLSGLAGWVFDIPLLKSVLPGAVEMKANTAIGLLLSACALFILDNWRSRPKQYLAQTLGWVVLALGLATLGQYLFGWQLGIDEWLFRDTTDAYNPIRGLMSPYSAVAFAFIGFALTALPQRSLRPLAQLAALIVIAIGAISFLGYLWNASELVTDRWLPPVAVNTAVVFILLGAGLLGIRRESGQQGLIRTSVELKVLAGFISAFALLLVMGAYTYRAGANYVDSAQWISHTQQVRAGLSRLYASIADVESAQRNYLLTGKKASKTKYQDDIAELNNDVNTLARLVADNPVQMKNLAELKLLLERRIALLAEHVRIFEHQDLAAARAAIVRDGGIQTMQAIRDLTDRMDHMEAVLLAEREAALRRDSELALVALLATLVGMVGILAITFLTIRREIMARMQTEDELRASEENLSVTLNSIGDAVLVTDTAGRVTRLNPIAERLTGWTQEAIGFPVADIFHIINFKTRQPAPIPVADVLAEGVIHGLANDTVLIARDGSEHAIADSCAPIRNRAGEVIGAVLVFRDVTEEYAVQAALQASEERYRTLFESMDEGFCVVEMIYDPAGKPVDYRFVEANPAFVKETGFQQGLGKTIRELVPDHEEHWFEIYGKVARTGESIRFENPARAMQRHYDVFAFRIGGEDDQRVGILFKDITENKRVELQLIAAKEQAELANRAKDSFLATMSHEIRTPLSGMLGMLEVLSLTPLNHDQEETLRAAWDSGRGLLRIVSDILDWSKIEEGKLELALQATSIPQLLQEVINTYSRVASAKSLVLRQHADARLSPAHIVDALRLSQVLNNFVSNALKFTHSGEVVLSAELLEQLDSDERIRFCVRDTGIGIARDAQRYLFRRYQQESVNTARLYGGTGLGLAICQKLVNLMDGQIELVSEPGQGSTFCITLTLPVSGSPTEVSQIQNLAVEQRAVKPLFADGADAPLVLAVDDHPINRDLLARQAKLLGLRVETAGNGAEALLMWRAGRFALVITDCHMPEMDGYALSRAIRKIETEEKLPRTPIIAWTANALPEEEAQCRAAGMDDLLVKPANLALLKQTLAKWLPSAETGNGQSASSSLHAADSGQHAGPIDHAVLDQIVPDSATQIQVLHDFQAHFRADCAKLFAMLAQGNPADVQRIAHRMKGASRMVGARDLANACATIEQAVRDGDMISASAAGAALDAAFRQLETYLLKTGIPTGRT